MARTPKLVLAFAGGGRVALCRGALRVEVDRGIVIDVSRCDDISICMKYLGSDLYLSRGRFGYPGDDADFLAAAQPWLDADCATELPWVVEVEMCLASRSSASSGAV